VTCNNVQLGGAVAPPAVSEVDAMVEAAPIGLGLFDADFRFRRVNARLASINGASADDHRGKLIEQILPAESCQLLRSMQPRLLAGEAFHDIELEAPDVSTGERRHWLLAYEPVRNAGGAITGFLGTVLDITERKRSEQREQLLALELEHRSKNLLSVIQAVIRLAPADSVDRYRQAISGRVLTLARTHGLMAGARSTGIHLAALVAEELAPFGGRAVAAGGPSVLLRAPAAQAMAMVLHELSTNAAKHGALATSGGGVSVGWSVDEPTGSLRLVWEETGGSSVSAPKTPGFGSTMMRASAAQVDGSLDCEWLPAGLRCTLSMPLTEHLGKLED
jgi:PAS domain S-box-containing protein